MRAGNAVVLGALALSATIQWAAADTRANPYGPIVERNAFGLKSPPPPPVEQPKEETKPPPNVKLTGISNLFQKRALIEITEQQGPPPKPGQPPQPGGTIHRPILVEGEGAFGVEVLSIDVERNVVKIRNAGLESELTFEAPKPPTGGPVAGSPGASQAYNPAMAAAAQQPTVIPSPNTQTTGGGGVTLYGGGTTTATPNNSGSGVTSYGGATPAIPSPLGSESGLRTIPSRTIRTPSNPEQQNLDAAQQAVIMEANRIANEKRSGRTYPPTPGVPNPPPPTPQPR